VLAKLILIACVVASPLTAQQRPDTTRGQVPVVPDSLVNPPISPGRAFLYSFLAPGLAQARLGRHKAAAAFVFVEAMSIVMIRESGADAHEARRFNGDSVVIVYNDTTPTFGVAQFTDREVHSRDAHLEDWVALLVANHLFAGADAFVAAHLWDVGVKLGLRRTPNGTALAVSFRP
jgi:hypothetical protein